jgi:hypothetical protein
LKVTVLVPCVAPKLVPLITTEVPTGPDVGDTLAMYGSTVKLTPLLAVLFTLTTTLPVVAPGGTGTVIEPAFQLVGDAVVPLNVTAPELAPKPVPAMVTLVPTIPEPGDKLATFGITVNAAPLLATPPTVTTTVPLPAAAAAGTGAVMDVALQLIGVAATPLNVTVLLPCELPNPVPAIVTAAPAMPEVRDKLLMFGTTVNATALLLTPPTVTTTVPLPPAAPVGTGAVMEAALQLVGVVTTPPNVTVLLPCELPNPEPVIVTAAPAMPEVRDKLLMFGTTVNATALLLTPPTVTTTVPLPPVAPAGTSAVMDVTLQLVGVAAMPLNVTVLLPCKLPKPDPVIVTELPAMPDVGDKLAMLGTTVKATPLLDPPFTVTTTLPVVAAAGTATAIEVDFQLVGVAATPLNATVLAPCEPPKPVPVTVTAVPTAPEVTDSPVITGSAVPVPVRFTVCGLLLALSVMVSVPG